MELLPVLIIVLLGACVHPDPAVGAFIIMGCMLSLMAIVTIPMWIYIKMNEPKWKAAEEAALKKKYPNAKPLSELIKELDDK